jgi:hypothetical protein
VQQIVLTNPGPSPVNLTSLTLSESGAAPSGVTSVTLLKNGVPVTTVVLSGNAATFNFSDTIPASSGSVTYQVQANFQTGASVGNYQFSITNASGNNGQPVLFSPLPVAGATITIAAATATPTNTPLSTPSSTLTVTPSFTPTPIPNQTPVLFPNPSSGGPVTLFLSLRSPSDVRVELFTLAFRKVQDRTFNQVPVGTDLILDLRDQWGTPLANGLYYVVVTTPLGQRSVIKLVLLR